MKKKSLHIRYVIVAVIAVLVIGGIFLFNNQGRGEITVSESTDFDKGEIKIAPDGTKYIIDPNKIRSGGPPKDGIPKAMGEIIPIALVSDACKNFVKINPIKNIDEITPKVTNNPSMIKVFLDSLPEN